MKRSTFGRFTLLALLAVDALACADAPTGLSDSVRVAASITTQSNTIVVGAPSNTQIRFPFGGALSAFAGTRYQQAYAAAAFNSTTPIRIEKISFLNGQGTLAGSTYSFYLSAITTPIDDLSDTDFDGNRGANNVLFASVQLSGAAPATLTIVGDAPFEYDPSQGNLLLDIVISPRATVPATPAFYAGRNDAFGVFSRYQNFGFGSIGSGLVTQFDLVQPQQTPPPVELTIGSLLATVEQAMTDGTLEGAGPGNSTQAMNAWLNMLYAAENALNADNTHGACAALLQAHLRADGAAPPPDFVAGTAAPALATMIHDLRALLECN